MYWYFYERYTPAKPKKVEGGIKAQSKGSFGKSWWAKRWIQVLESFNIGKRLGRGKTYARKGQVVSIDISEGKVKAKVQGTRVTPYTITIKVQTLNKEQWQKVGEELSRQAIFAAKLLAGEMPENIEKIFGNTHLSLFPKKSRDLETNCSCPDRSNPCKHIAAVYYLLGEEFDRDPFLIFKLRGMDRQRFLAMLSNHAHSSDDQQPSQELQPLSIEGTTFWQGQDFPANQVGQVRIPPVHAAILKRLGNFPFWRGDLNFSETLTPAYSRSANAGMNLLAQQTESQHPQN